MDNKKKKKKKKVINFIIIIIIILKSKWANYFIYFCSTLCVDKKYIQVDQTTSSTLYILSVTTGHSLFNSMINIKYILLLQGYSCVVIIYSDHWRCVGWDDSMLYVMTKDFQLC